MAPVDCAGAYWEERPELFSAFADVKDEEGRALVLSPRFRGFFSEPIESLHEVYFPFSVLYLAACRVSYRPPARWHLHCAPGFFYGFWPDKNVRGETRVQCIWV